MRVSYQIRVAFTIQTLLFIFFLLFFFPSISFCQQAACKEADSFDYPVLNKDLDSDLFWNVPFNRFGRYYDAMGGYHPGEDWNAVGKSPNADLGKPVRSIANGEVVKISYLKHLGYLVAIEHLPPEGETFLISKKSDIENSQTFEYQEESVYKIFSIYVHIENLTVELNQCVTKGQVLGSIMDPGGGPHLHFEIRHPNTRNSNNWSLVGDKKNWAMKNGFPTGYYLNLQDMVDSGTISPTEFIKQNKQLARKKKLSYYKKGLYCYSKEIQKTTFEQKKRAMVGLKINHPADGSYFVRNKPQKVILSKPMNFYLVPNRGAYYVGADEMKGTVFEVKRNFHVYRMQSNGLFLKVFDAKKYGLNVGFHSTTISDQAKMTQGGIIRWREQLISLEVDLCTGKYVLFEGEGNVFDNETYPTKKQGCWYIELVDK